MRNKTLIPMMPFPPPQCGGLVSGSWLTERFLLYSGNYLEFFICNGVQVCEFRKKKNECINKQKEFIAEYLLGSKENLPFRFWENVVMRDKEMTLIIEEMENIQNGS